jgi:hypothetical protein
VEKYLLLLHGNASEAPNLSPAEMQAMFAKYHAWSQSLKDKGRYLAGNKLEDGTGKVMRSNGGTVRVTDGPFAETKDVIGGYYLIQVANYDEAVATCQDCPHLAFGTIEIRRIEAV